MPARPTAAQSEASRLNAAKSTGPRTEQGKLRSAQNARKDGFYAQRHLHPEEAQALPTELLLWLDEYQPTGRGAVAQTVRGALAAVRLRRFLTFDTSLERQRADHALNRLDTAAATELERLKALLPTQPNLAVTQLRQTPEGIDWLIDQWDAIAFYLERGEPLPVEKFTQSLLLRGEHPDLRNATRQAYCLSSWDLKAKGGEPNAPHRFTADDRRQARDRLLRDARDQIKHLTSIRPATAARAERDRDAAPTLAVGVITPEDRARHHAESAAGLSLDRALRYLDNLPPTADPEPRDDLTEIPTPQEDPSPPEAPKNEAEPTPESADPAGPAENSADPGPQPEPNDPKPPRPLTPTTAPTRSP